MLEFKIDKKSRKMLDDLVKSGNELPFLFLRDLSNLAERVMGHQVMGRMLKVRSGRLSQSIGALVDRPTLTSWIGSGVRTGQPVSYAAIHTTGGILKPTKGKYLAIPMPSIRQRASGMISGNELSPRDFKGTFFYRSKKGTLMLAQDTGSGIRNLFSLHRSVKIPKRDYVGATSTIMQRQYGKVLDETMRKVKL